MSWIFKGRTRRLYVMKITYLAIGLWLPSLLHGAVLWGQPSAKIATPGLGVTITEPGIISLEQLFKTSDIVAVVRVISGDAESYNVAIYKAEVVQAFKGTAAGNILYFGPFLGQRLGMESVVFLRKAKEPAVPKNAQSASYGTVKYLEVFNEGYSAMDVSYECLFDGKDPVQQCDYGVRVCTDYIVLPEQTPVFPPISEVTDFGCRWVRKSRFSLLLENFTDHFAPDS